MATTWIIARARKRNSLLCINEMLISDRTAALCHKRASRAISSTHEGSKKKFLCSHYIRAGPRCWIFSELYLFQNDFVQLRASAL